VCAVLLTNGNGGDTSPAAADGTPRAEQQEAAQVHGRDLRSPGCPAMRGCRVGRGGEAQTSVETGRNRTEGGDMGRQFDRELSRARRASSGGVREDRSSELGEARWAGRNQNEVVTCAGTEATRAREGN
jgi:hypothetical protein